MFRQYTKSAFIEAEQQEKAFSIENPDQGTLIGKAGDWIARDPENLEDQWVINAEFFARNYSHRVP